MAARQSERRRKLRNYRGRRMFFDDVSEIPKIAKKVSTGIFVVPSDVRVELPLAIELSPNGKSVITIEQVREVLGLLSVKQTTDLYVLIRPADKLGEDAANALLKTLEEPSEKVHFILVTESPSALLPTVLSRAFVYYLRVHDDEFRVDNKTKELAKRLMVARGAELVAVAEEIAKKKDGVRAYALNVVGAAIEMLYRSYYITGKLLFLSKLPAFLATYDTLARNGHVKLQIVSNLGVGGS